MKEIHQEISEELYSEYRAMRYPERSAVIEKHVPIEWLYGYGYYGHRLSVYGDKFYVVHTMEIVAIDRIVINRSVRLCGAFLYQTGKSIWAKQKPLTGGVQEVYT